MSEPNIDTVAAVHTRTKAPLRQIDGPVPDDIAAHGSGLDLGITSTTWRWNYGQTLRS